MNPFELTKDPDGGGTTVRVKHGFVVLTREEEKQITERITEILTENAKLRELIADVHEALRADKAGMFHKLILASMEDDMQKLGIEADE